jgi:ABC-2 type transport system ATP-binding protein
LNAEETLQFYGRLFKISSAERNKRVSQLIDMVGLTSAKHRQLREYSKGMQRRIGLAQALINNPELILLDEPTSGLDPIGTSEIKHLIRELREQGKTIVLSGHLLADMQDICDRIAILHRGELKEIGRVSDLLTVKDVTQIKARNLSPAAVEEIKNVIHRHGGDDVMVDHPTTTLEELFLRIVQESEAHPGRRKVAHDKGRPSITPEGELAGARSKP